jgi:hypothetical protein
MGESDIVDHQNLQGWALRARRDAILDCLEIVQRILPAHDDLSCCFGVRQNILSALNDRRRGWRRRPGYRGAMSNSLDAATLEASVCGSTPVPA